MCDKEKGSGVLLVLSKMVVIWKYGVDDARKQATNEIMVEVDVEKSSTTPG